MISIFKRTIIFSALLTWAISAVALAMPDDLSSMTATQLKNYLYAQKAQMTAVAKDKATAPAFTADELISWGKEDLFGGNPSKALVFFQYALILYPKNQVAAFYAAISLLGTNSDISTELEQLGLMNTDGQIIGKKHQPITLPDVISFNSSQALIAGWNSDQIKEAITLLSEVNQTFSDTITNPKLGTVNIDYSAVQAVLLVLNEVSSQMHFANAYSTDFAQISKNDLGELTPDNLKSVTSDVNTLYAQLISNGYITKTGHVTYVSTYVENSMQPNVLLYYGSNLGSNNYVFYTWLGAGNHRVSLNPGDCGPQTVYRGNGTVLTSYTPTLDTTTGMCISPVISTTNGPLVGGTDIYTINLSMTHDGKAYSLSNFHYYPEYSLLSSFLSYTPIDPVLSASNSAAIFNVLNSISQDKLSFLELLNFYPQLLAHKATTPAELLAAKNNLLGMVNAYLNLESYVLAQDEKLGPNYAIQAYTPANPSKHTLTTLKYEQEKLAHQAQQQAIHNLMLAIKNNLTNSAKYPYVQPNDPSFGAGNMLAPFKINFASFFSTSRDVRGYTKLVEQELNQYHLFPDNFYDPSLGGLFPGATNADLNSLLNDGGQIHSASIQTVQGTKNIVLVWSPALRIKSGQNIIAFNLYRSTTATVNNKSTLIASMSPNSYFIADSQTDPTVATYYYRLYTYYRFTDNTTASSYSKVFKVTLIPTVTSTPPVIFQIPNQTMNAGDTLTLYVQGVDLNGLNIIWNANIQTKITSYGDTWGNCSSTTESDGVPISCSNGPYFIQLTPSASVKSGTFNVTVYASDSQGAQSTMSFIVTVLPLPTGVIHGEVVNSTTRRPMANVVIKAQGTLSFSAVTNAAGLYTLNAVPFGQYVISASLEKYKTNSNNVTLTKTALNETDNISLCNN